MNIPVDSLASFHCWCCPDNVRRIDDHSLIFVICAVYSSEGLTIKHYVLLLGTVNLFKYCFWLILQENQNRLWRTSRFLNRGHQTTPTNIPVTSVAVFSVFRYKWNVLEDIPIRFPPIPVGRYISFQDNFVQKSKELYGPAIAVVLDQHGRAVLRGLDGTQLCFASCGLG